MGDEATLNRILNGCFDDLPKQEHTAVRVFFSSTFTGKMSLALYMDWINLAHLYDYPIEKVIKYLNLISI